MGDRDASKKSKFFRLLGVREEEMNDEEVKKLIESKKKEAQNPRAQYSKIQKDLEHQYEVGVQHRHNRKGLGFH